MMALCWCLARPLTADEPITDVEGMLMDDETAKKVEKDWIANQPFEKLADPSKDGVPQGFARFSWLRSNDVAQYWWVYPSVVVGVVVFSLGTPLLTEGWMDHNSILFSPP